MMKFENFGSKSFKGLSNLSALSGSFSRGDLRKLGSGNLGNEEFGGGASSQQRFFTCTVGRKPSAAKFYLDDVDEVSELLASLKAQHDRKVKDLPPSYHTWSGGDMKKGGLRVGSMPALSSL